jgi:antitoxin VapB
MSLNIKNPEAHKLAAELARRTGTSLTEAVTEALRDKLAVVKAPEEQARREEEAAKLIADVEAIAQRMRDALGPEALAAMDIDALYDERGLPR